MNIGEKIRKLRNAKMMTQSELSGNQITRNMLSRIENGGALPSLPTMLYLAEKLGVKPGYLIAEEDEEFYYRKMECMPDIRRAYFAGDWNICRDLCEELGSDGGEIDLIVILCIYNTAVEAFFGGNLRDACRLFAEVLEKSEIMVYPVSQIVAESTAYLLYIRNISPSLDCEIDIGDSVPLQALSNPVCLYFALMNDFEDEALIPGITLNRVHYIRNAGKNEAIYADHIRARILMEDKNYSEAYRLLKTILSESVDVPAPMLYYLFSDLEICCREFFDYKGAHEYSADKTGMIERFLR